MTLKTNWVSDPEVRNTLSYIDIGVLTLMVSYNMSLVTYCIYLDYSVIYKYVSNRLAKTFFCKNLYHFKKWVTNLFCNNANQDHQNSFKSNAGKITQGE